MSLAPVPAPIRRPNPVIKVLQHPVTMFAVGLALRNEMLLLGAVVVAIVRLVVKRKHRAITTVATPASGATD